MSEQTSSPGLKATRQKAPQPSPALLALQEKGFEISGSRVDSILPPYSHGPPDENLRVSPLSIVSTPPDLDKTLQLKLEEKWERRSSSAGSAETTVTGILNLYSNLSEWSLKSEYEELTPYPDDSDDETLLPTVHQPKAYRDTIAPLLEHQSSSYNLTVPPAPSPQSVASMPKLMHPDANASIASLHLTLQLSPNMQQTTDKIASLSQTSIQITPDITPPLGPIDSAPAPSFRQYSQSLAQRKVALEVPDVRDAESWYDYPISPVSPEADDHNRLSQQSVTSAMSQMSVGYERQIAYETLAPPLTKKSPNMRPVSFMQDDFLPGPMSATLTHVVDNKTITPPLDLARDRPPSRIDEEKIAARQAQLQFQYNAEEERQIQQAEKERQASQARFIIEDPIEGPMRTYLTSEPQDRKVNTSALSVDKQHLRGSLERPSSAFSSDSSDSYVIHDTLSGQFKAIWRHKFKKKKERGSKHGTNTKQKQTKSGSALDGSLAFNDDIESYRYPYKLSRPSAPKQPVARSRHGHSFDLNNSTRGNIASTTLSLDSGPSLISSGPGPSVPATPEPERRGTRSSHDPRRRSPQPAIPLTRYQKYGAEIWYESNKKKRREEREAARKAAEGTDLDEGRKPPDLEVDRYMPSSAGVSGLFYSQSDSTNASHPSTEGGRPSGTKTMTNSKTSDGGQRYNDSIFEASGGKKKNGFASRLLLSSEEKRKMKVKESITIVGGVKMGGSSDGDSGGASGGGKPLVKL